VHKMLYVGVDASKATAQITVVDEAGKVLKRMRVLNSREGLQVVLGRHRRQMKAVLEASYSWGPETLAHLLRAGLIPAAYAPGKEVRATKRVLRQRLFFVRVRTMLKNRIQALLSGLLRKFGDVFHPSSTQQSGGSSRPAASSAGPSLSG
jgi:transposase